MSGSRRATAAPPMPPSLPDGHVLVVPGRGEIFARVALDGDGVAVVLIHGWTADADLNFHPVFASLAGRPVVAPDLRGHGRSAIPEVRFTLEDAADDVAATIAHLGIVRAVVVGYSLGGAVAQLLADRHPHLVAGLVLAGSDFDPPARPWKKALVRVEGWLTGARRLTAGRWLSHRLVDRAARENPAVESLRPWLVSVFERGHPGALRDAGRALGRFDARPLAARRRGTVPVAVVVTERDRLVRPGQQRALAATWGAAVVSLDADHDAPVAQPQRFRNAILRALDVVDECRRTAMGNGREHFAHYETNST